MSNQSKTVSLPAVALVPALGAQHPVAVHLTTVPDAPAGPGSGPTVRLSVSGDELVWYVPLELDATLLARALVALGVQIPRPAPADTLEEPAPE
jgi:hypothetical protein